MALPTGTDMLPSLPNNGAKLSELSSREQYNGAAAPAPGTRRRPKDRWLRAQKGCLLVRR